MQMHIPCQEYFVYCMPLSFNVFQEAFRSYYLPYDLQVSVNDMAMLFSCRDL